jgi:hypothetical protein
MQDIYTKARRAILLTVQREGYPGVLGKADGTLAYGDSKDQVWARTGYGDATTEIVVVCTSVQKIYGLPVMIADREGRPTVIRSDTTRASDFAGG